MATSKIIKTGLAIAALLVGTLAARAADLPGKAPSYTAPSYFSWSGFYIGANAGYGWGTADWVTPPPVSIKTTGYVYGGTLGYNYQMSSFVLGVEGDFDLSTIKGSDTTVCGASPGCQTNLKWLATGRARIGYAFDRWLPYLTGGVAYASLQNSGPDASETKSKLGWALGAGVEYAFMSSWSAKVEYLYVDLGTTTCLTCFTGLPQDVKYKVNLVRAGVNYRF